MSQRRAPGLLFVALSVAGFGSACHPDSSGPIPCGTAGVPTGCNAPCNSTVECAEGLYCTRTLTCRADCVRDGSQCRDGETCGPHGFCIDRGLEMPDFSNIYDLSGECPRVVVQLTGIRPTVELLIDRSGSMAMKDGANSLSRWDLVRYALTDASVGVVTKLQANVYFGAVLFTAVTMCPELSPSFSAPIVPALNNLGNVGFLFSHFVPNGATPTAASLKATADYLHGLPPTGNGASIIVLATDGQPNSCDDMMTDDTPATVAAASYAFGLGVEVYVLGVGPSTTDTQLQTVANAGRGVASGAKFYRGTLPAELVAAFNEIIVSKRSCTLKLSGVLSEFDAPKGDIELDGVKLGYGDPNGWSQTGPTSVQLAGTACTHYLEKDVPLSATFPCGTLIL